MSDKEIEFIANDYVCELLGKQDYYAKSIYYNFLKWLQKEYQIIPKDKLEEIYQSYYSDINSDKSLPTCVFTLINKLHKLWK